MEDPRRRLPRTDAVLADPALAAALERHGRARVRSAVRTALEACRAGRLGADEVADEAQRILQRPATSMRPVVNATGVVVHTNLGRAPLSEAAVDALVRVAGTTDVELDLTTGRRGRRGGHAVDALLAAVPEAAAAHVVNNGAAALALVATSLCGGREMVVARGELVEIGDGFRIPDLLEASGARIREVGTTNRVRLADYAEAIGPETGAIVKVHPSNFTITGFTSSVPVRELATLGPPVVADIGSGLLRPHRRLPDEPDAATALHAGAALVTASCDKLLGGPQAGVILGDADLVRRLRRHPLARALRVDKLTLAALEATLSGPPPPVTRMLESGRALLRARAKSLADLLADLVDVALVDTEAAVGGGGAPGVTLPSAGISLPQVLTESLRTGDPPVVGRLDGGRLVLDLIAVPPELDGQVAEAVRVAAKEA